jgi:hypothetical protein
MDSPNDSGFLPLHDQLVPVEDSGTHDALVSNYDSSHKAIRLSLS